MINNNYANYSSHVADDAICSVCLGSMKNTDVLAHEGAGHLHLLHKSCAKTAAAFSDKCPTYKKPINRDSQFTLKEKAVITMNFIKKDGVAIAVIGLAAVAVTALIIDSLLLIGTGNSLHFYLF